MGGVQQYLPIAVLKRYCIVSTVSHILEKLQQYLPLAVCDEGCEAAEE